MTDPTTTDRPASPLAALLSDPERVAALDVEKMRALLEMRREEEREAAVAAHAAALARFQSACPSIRKNAEGAHRARYATLDHILDVTRAPLGEAGLAVTFDSEETDDGRLRVWAIVHHAAGHSTRSSFTVSREAPSNRMNDTQRDGSAMSYGRRYALCLALGLSTGDRDDDGHAATQAAATVSLDQALNLSALAEEQPELGAKLLAWAKVESWEDVAAHRYAAIVGRFEKGRAG